MNPYQNLKKINEVVIDMQTLTPLADKIILVNLDHGVKKSLGGVILADDSTTDAGERGIRARWAQVYAAGPDQKDVKRGDWVLMDHGRWSLGQDLDLGEGTFRFWLGDPNGILGLSETIPDGIEPKVTI
jgi:co-chaperonin GroES (HSP10)